MNEFRSERPQALVVYESMFGCTEEVARAVAEGLRDGGFVTSVVDVREADPRRDSDVDLLVVGAPTHAFSLSRPRTREDAVRQGGRPESAAAGLREWLTALGTEVGAQRPAAAFDTRVTKVRRIPMAASTRAARLLAGRGFAMASPPTPFLVEDLKGPLAAGETERARSWGHQMAVSVIDSHAPGAATTT
jgi:hypothetical protein